MSGRAVIETGSLGISGVGFLNERKHVSDHDINVSDYAQFFVELLFAPEIPNESLIFLLIALILDRNQC
jgi:hypothetical protein